MKFGGASIAAGPYDFALRKCSSCCFNFRPAKPFNELRDSFFDLHLGIVTEQSARFLDVGESNGHVARLRWLALNDGAFAESVFEQFNQARECDRLRFAQIENLIAEFFLRGSNDSVERVGNKGVIAGG